MTRALQIPSFHTDFSGRETSHRIGLWCLGLMLCTFARFAQAQLPPIRIAAQSSVLNLDPHAYNERFNNAMVQHIYEPLLGRTPDLQIIPGLATSWQRSGQREWQVSLRRGVSFHHGDAFSAEDVVFSIQRAQHTDSALRVFALMLGKVTAAGEHVVLFETPQPQPLFAEGKATSFL